MTVHCHCGKRGHPLHSVNCPVHGTKAQIERAASAFAEELRKWGRFDDRQQHRHSWHDREDFIEKKLPELLARVGSM